MQTVALPWPPKELNPNARVHWARKARVAKQYRGECYYMTKMAGIRAPEGDIELSLEFRPPDKRHRDDDNLIGMFKPGRDGVAQALGIDDRRFRLAIEVGEVSRGCGLVCVSIAPLPKP